MTASRLDPVAEELALRNLVSHYADAVIRQAAVELSELFTADGVWDVVGHGQPRGPAEIAAFFGGVLEQWDTLVQALLSGRIALDPVDPDRATGRWYICEFGRRADGVEVKFSGVYHDEYVRDVGRWRFARRRYDSLFRRIGGDVSTAPFPTDVPSM